MQKFKFSFDINVPDRGDIFVISNQKPFEARLLDIDWQKPREESLQGLFAVASNLTPNAYSFLLVRCLESLANRVQVICSSVLIDEVLERPVKDPCPDGLFRPFSQNQVMELITLIEILLTPEGPMNAGQHANFDDQLRELRNAILKLVA